MYNLWRIDNYSFVHYYYFYFSIKNQVIKEEFMLAFMFTSKLTFRLLIKQERISLTFTIDELIKPISQQIGGKMKHYLTGFL